MACEREKVLALLLKLEKEVARACPRAGDIITVYRERIENLVEESIEAELFK